MYESVFHILMMFNILLNSTVCIFDIGSCYIALPWYVDQAGLELFFPSAGVEGMCHHIDGVCKHLLMIIITFSTFLHTTLHSYKYYTGISILFNVSNYE